MFEHKIDYHTCRWKSRHGTSKKCGGGKPGNTVRSQNLPKIDILISYDYNNKKKLFHIVPFISPRSYIIPWACWLSGWYHDLGLIKVMIWKMPCNNLYLTYIKKYRRIYHSQTNLCSFLSLHDKCLNTKSTTTHADENPDMGQAKHVAGKNRLIPYDPKSSKNLIFGSLTIIIIKRSCIDRQAVR
jgi:hypothetical protein